MRIKTLTATAAMLIALIGLQAQDATQYQHRAASLLLNGEYSAACTELEQAVQLYKTQKDWKPYFACLTQLTQAYLSANKLAAAKKTAKRALWQSINILGRDNDEAARASHQLAQVYAAASRYDDALHFHGMALDIRTALFGPLHPLVADSHCLLAETLQQQGSYPRAEQQLHTALSILQEAYHAKHAETAPALSQLGQLYHAMGQKQEAESFCEQAVEVLRSARVTDPERLADALVQLAKLSEPEQKGKLLQEALTIIRKQENPSGATAAEVFAYAGHKAAAAGRITEALNYSQSAVLASAGVPSADGLHKSVLLLSGDIALAKADPQMASSIYQRLIQADSPAGLLLKGATAAMLSEQWPIAQQWAGWAAQSAAGEERYAAILLQAQALLEGGQPEEALNLLKDPMLEATTNASFRAEACFIAGEVAFRQKAYQDAVSYFQKGLDQNPKAADFLQMQLHAKLGSAHTTLALQDRNTVYNLKEADRHFEDYLRLLNSVAASQPLSLADWQWLQTNSASIYELALHTCYLQYQPGQEEKWIHAAFQYMESFRTLNLYAEQALHHPSTTDQRLRYLSLKDRGAEYENALEEWRVGKHPPTLQPISFQSFNNITGQNDMQALHYLEGTAHLFILGMTPTGCSLLRQRWTEEERKFAQVFSGLRSYAGLLQQGERLSAWLLPALANAESAPRILLFPSTSLQRFPFAGLPTPDGLIGTTYELYRNVSAGIFATQYQIENPWPAPDAAIVELEVNKQATTAGAVALPTKQLAPYACAPLLSEWAQQQGSTLLSPYQWANAQLQSIGILLLPQCGVDSLLSYLPKSERTIHQLLLPMYSTGKHRPFAVNHAFTEWQRRGAKQIFYYPRNCRTPPDYMLDALTSWQSSGDMAQAVLKARQTTIAELGETGELPAHWLQAQLIGVPASPKNKVTANVPIRWILLTIGLLIVIGWWVKR